MHVITAVVRKCGNKWCVYKHKKNSSEIMHPQPKGWPKHYVSKEKAKRGLQMMKTFGSLIRELRKVGAGHLAKKIEAYETQIQYPRMWSPDPTHTQQPKENARDSNKSYNNPGQPLGVQYLSEDFLSRLGFTKPEALPDTPLCPGCGLKFAERYAYCPKCGQKYPSNPTDFLRSMQYQDMA